MTSDVLVAGGAGFLGSHLCEALLDRGLSVLALDDLSTGRRSNVEHLVARDGFRLIAPRDVREPFRMPVSEAWSGRFIYNLASPASPPRYQQSPVRTLLVNVVGTCRMLEVAEATGARLLQASTSEVYGDPLVHPQPESYRGSVSTTGPRACYDEGKRAAETLCFDFERRGVDVRVARIFNTYGPRMDPEDGRVVSNFVTQALAGEPLTVYGDGRQTRSLCYVADTVAGLIALMESDVRGPVNIGNPDERTVLSIATAVILATGSKAGVRFLPLPVDDPRQRCPDISLAHDRLGWEPGTSLTEGLARTVAGWETRGDTPAPLPVTSSLSDEDPPACGLRNDGA